MVPVSHIRTRRKATPVVRRGRNAQIKSITKSKSQDGEIATLPKRVTFYFHGGIKMKRLSTIGLAALALGVSGVAFGDGSITPTQINSPEPGALIYGKSILVAGLVDDSATISVDYEQDGGVAWAIRQRGDDLASATCTAPRETAIVAGNVEGFFDVASIDGDGVFSADVGAMDLPAGLYCFALNYPGGGGRDYVDFYIVDGYTKFSGTVRWDAVASYVRGNSPTHAFDALVGDAGDQGVVGAININLRYLGQDCTYLPPVADGFEITTSVVADESDALVRAVMDDWLPTSSDCPTLRTIRALDRSARSDYKRGGVYAPGALLNIGAPIYWVPLNTGNAHVGFRPTN